MPHIQQIAQTRYTSTEEHFTLSKALKNAKKIKHYKLSQTKLQKVRYKVQFIVFSNFVQNKINTQVFEVKKRSQNIWIIT